MNTTKLLDPRIIKARVDLLQGQPFWGALLLYLKVKEDTTCQTLWTNGKEIGYNPAFLDTMSPPEIKGALAHEVGHCMSKHHTRRNGRDPDLWNTACDYALNPLILQAGFKLPDGILLDARFRNMSAEEIYRVLDKEQKQQQEEDRQQDDESGEAGDDQDEQADSGDEGEGDEEGEGQSESGAGGDEEGQDSDAGGDAADGDAEAGEGQGEGADGDGDGGEGEGEGDEAGEASDQPGKGGKPSQGGDPGRCGEVRDAPLGNDPAAMDNEEREWDSRVKAVINAENARLAGQFSSEIKAYVDQQQRSQVDWREALTRFINDKTRIDHSWTRPNKRLLGQGYILPGMIPDGVNQIVAMCDSSGSIYQNKDYLARFEAELAAALELGMMQSLVIVWCDWQVKGVQEFQLGDKVKLTPVGGGGTAFSPALDFVARHYPDAAALIYFTDLECEDFGTEPYVPLMWVAYGPRHEVEQRAAKVPFGEVVIMGEGK